MPNTFQSNLDFVKFRNSRSSQNLCLIDSKYIYEGLRKALSSFFSNNPVVPVILVLFTLTYLQFFGMVE